MLFYRKTAYTARFATEIVSWREHHIVMFVMLIIIFVMLIIIFVMLIIAMLLKFTYDELCIPSTVNFYTIYGILLIIP